MGRSIHPPGALMGPSMPMGPELGVPCIWGPDKAVNEVPLAPANCGGLLRNYYFYAYGTFVLFSHLEHARFRVSYQLFY